MEYPHLSSKVQICNRALSKLGAGRITSLSDGTKSAKECNAIYDDVAEEVMSMGRWPSVVNRATLAQSTTTPDFEYSYQYALPTNPRCLRILEINELRAGDVKYSVEGGFLLTDEPTVSIKYLGRIVDPEQYDIYLRKAIIFQLVADLAYVFTGQATVAEKMTGLAEAKIADLLNMACVQGSSREIPSDQLIDVRNSD